MVFEDTKRPFKAGDVTVISCDVPHTTYSAPGAASRWSYLFVDLTGLLTPLSSGSDLRIFNLLNTLEHRICLILDEQGVSGNPRLNSGDYERTGTEGVNIMKFPCAVSSWPC